MTPEALIEKYFKDGLTAAEEKVLNDYLKDSPERAEAFEMEKDLQTALVDVAKDDLRQRLNDREATQVIAPEEEESRRSFIKYAVAAAIIIGVTLFGVNTFTGKQASTDELYAQYFEPYRNVIAPIERGEDTDLTDEEKVFAAYELGEYEEALEGINKLQEKNKAPYLAFYESIILLQLEQTADAIVLLEQHPQGDAKFYDKSRWYLGLGYLKVGEIDKAKEVFSKISSSGHYKQKEAIHLLKSLNSY